MWPLFRAKSTLKKSANNPDTFDKKIRYKMAYDRNELLTIFADKVVVREYVSTRIGQKYLASVYAILDQDGLDDFNPDILPNNFVIKANHGSGGVIIISESADKSASLPTKNIKDFSWERYLIHPNNVDWRTIKLILKKWLSMNYYWRLNHLPEWAYKDIQPKIIFEEFIGNGIGELNDYRFYTFDGKCEFISSGLPFYKRQELKPNFYTLDWNKISVRGIYPNYEGILPRPSSLDEMISVADSLANGTDHVRVDLYNYDGRVVFGEMTNYHAAGCERFIPESFNFEFGKSWHPETLY
jgi:hypothetical protein